MPNAWTCGLMQAVVIWIIFSGLDLRSSSKFLDRVKGFTFARITLSIAWSNDITFFSLLSFLKLIEMFSCKLGVTFQYKSAVVFALGETTNETLRRIIKQESTRYRDIIQQNFLDAYKLLVLKVHIFQKPHFLWTSSLHNRWYMKL